MDEDLADLVAAWTGAELPQARCDALLARLAADAEFRRAFADEARMLGLAKVVQSAEPRWLRLGDELGWSAGGAGDDGILARLALEPPHRPPARRWLWALVAAVAVAAASASVVGLRPRPAPPPPPASPDGVAALVGAAGAVWDGPPPAVGAVLPPGVIKLRAGTAAVAPFGGVTIYAEGPAELELPGLDRAVCRRGRFRVSVPPLADGFVTYGPGCAVIDLGTEFALTVGDDGRTDVAVFDGTAKVFLVGPQGEVLRGEPLAAGRSLAVDPDAGTLTPGPLDPARYAAAIETPLPVFDPPAAYPAAVRASRPWAYWRFDAPEHGAFASEVPGRPALRAAGGVRGERSGGNGVAAFRPGGPDQMLAADGPWTPPREAGFAVELWAASRWVTPQTLAALVVQPEAPPERHYALVEVGGRRPAWPHPPTAVRFLHRFPTTRPDGDTLMSRPAFAPHRWHHVVAQRAGGALELYLDGELHASGPATPADPPPCRLLLGRLKRTPQTDPMQVRAFAGALDEAAVYDRPLTADEVRRHYSAAGR